MKHSSKPALSPLIPVLTRGALSPKRRFLAALFGAPVDRVPVGNVVSVATMDLAVVPCFSRRDTDVVKEMAFASGDVADMVPDSVIGLLHAKMRELGGDGGGKVKTVSVRD